MQKLILLAAALLLPVPARVAPNPPPITEPSTDGQIVNPADVHMEAGPYSNASPHASTDWEVRKVSSNELIWSAPAVTDSMLRKHIHLADGSFVGSYAGRTTLEYDLDYRLVVRFRNTLGETSSDSVRLFRTSVAGPPGVAVPLPWVPFQSGYRVEVVATGFQLPVNIAFVPTPGPLPGDPMFYVTELYGTIKVVSRNGTVSNYITGLVNYDPTALGSFPGKGEQGLTGICVNPATGDLYATLLQQIDPLTRNPKVIWLKSTNGGKTGTIFSTLLMSGEDEGQSHQISNCSIGPDGKLYVHNGDGFDYTTAGNLDSFRGKVLRMNLDLTPATDNPHYADPGASTARKYVWAYGLRNPFGGAWRASDSTHYEVENGPTVDRLARLISNRNMGWNNTDGSMSTFALYNWNLAHAPVNIVFVQPETFAGSGFPPGKMDRAYVTESGPTHAPGPQVLGKRIVEFQLATGDTPPLSGPTTLVEFNGTGYGTAVALAAGPDGLYFSDLYNEQSEFTPAMTGGQILRVRYSGIPPNGSGTGFDAEYFPSVDLTGTSFKRTDTTIDFNWPGTTAPDPSLPGDNFSVRWTGRIRPRTTDSYTFFTQSIDGVRLWVNGVQLVDNWTTHASTEDSGTLSLVGGNYYSVVMEYFSGTGDGLAKLSWSGPSQPLETIPQSQLYGPAPAVIAAGSGACGLLGLEALALALAAAGLRRRR